MIKSSILLVTLAWTQLVQGQTGSKANPIPITLTNNAAPGSMRLVCDYGSINWSHDGQLLYTGSANQFQNGAQALFKTDNSGRVLENIQPLDGQYIGLYSCYDAGEISKSRYYSVSIPGASTLSGGQIAGIVIGVLLALLLIAGLIFFGFRQGWFGENEQYDQEEGNDILEDNLNETNSTARFKKPTNNRTDINGSTQYP